MFRAWAVCGGPMVLLKFDLTLCSGSFGGLSG